jgi:hypothetical protein
MNRLFSLNQYEHVCVDKHDYIKITTDWSRLVQLAQCKRLPIKSLKDYKSGNRIEFESVYEKHYFPGSIIKGWFKWNNVSFNTDDIDTMGDELYGIYDKMDDFFRHLVIVHMDESAPFRHFIVTFNNRVMQYTFQTHRDDLLSDLIFLKDNDNRVWVFKDISYDERSCSEYSIDVDERSVE